jgi:hydrogenase maturation protein HypF
LKKIRLRLDIRGAVQGVGFRPTVYRYAREVGLGGFVTNDSSGVQIEVQGDADACRAFSNRLKEAPPPAAVLREFIVREIPVETDSGVPGDFVIRQSQSGSQAYISIPPDLDLCRDCARELFDSSNRRYQYPFINCTNCGPRFTITRSMPYDRPETTMSCFPLCPDCKSEYLDPMDRRFHAQPVACALCGPRVWLEGYQPQDKNKGKAKAALSVLSKDLQAIIDAGKLLADDGILAMRGLGGFHLICDAASNAAVSQLRMRKKRPAKPLAIMCRNLEIAQSIVELSAEEKELLQSTSRPIVLARSKGGKLAGRVSPDNSRVGVMLPYTPLHMLLMESLEDQGPAAGNAHSFDVLVMTSGNRRDEPICCDNSEARIRLSGIADAWLLHDREIHNRLDDSIVMQVAGQTRIVRRARGYTPGPVKVKSASENDQVVLGVGGELKGAFCMMRGGQAYMSQYLGQLTESGNAEFFRESLVRMIQLLGRQPDVIACDAHPDYFSSVLARSWPQELFGHKELRRPQRVVKVQHHRAHALSVLAELGEQAPERSLAVVLDGTGWGDDGTAWGGEFLLITDYGACWQRLAHLEPFQLLGGDAAIKEPWRQALALVRKVFDRKLPSSLQDWFATQAGGSDNLDLLGIMMDRGVNSPFSSGAGRLFDAVGALVAGIGKISFEAQAAMALEHLATQAAEAGSYEFRVSKPLGNVPLRLDPAPAVREIVTDLASGRDARYIAASFQNSLAHSCAALAAKLASENNAECLLLSGGCFQNGMLLSAMGDALEQAGVPWYANRQVPTNDGGIALGQVLAATLS